MAESDRESLSERWKGKFALIDKAGGANLPKFKELSFRERMSLMSIPAFFIGPIYYMFKGMWKRAITLLVACLAILIPFDYVLEITGLGGLGDRGIAAMVGVMFSLHANVHYYKKVVLSDNESVRSFVCEAYDVI